MNPLNLPKLTKYINDFSDIFSTEKIESLSQLFIDHENRTTEQVVTVFIPHREGNELLEIGLKVFNENGIGQKNLNNGILLIVATDEKKIRIIVGKGMELKYTEMDCRDIIENHLRPLLNEGKYEELILTFSRIINNTYTIPKEKNNKTPIFFPDPEKNIIFEIPKNSQAEGVAMITSFFVIILVVIFFIRGCSQADWSVGNSSNSNYSSDGSYSTKSDWGSSSDSSSNFGGGGGSSNGGGYGD